MFSRKRVCDNYELIKGRKQKICSNMDAYEVWRKGYMSDSKDRLLIFMMNEKSQLITVARHKMPFDRAFINPEDINNLISEIEPFFCLILREDNAGMYSKKDYAIKTAVFTTLDKSNWISAGYLIVGENMLLSV